MTLDRPTILSFTITLAFIAVIFIWFFYPFPADTPQMTVLNVLLGALGSKFATVVDYDFGSSSGSKAKDVALRTAETRAHASRE